MDCKLSFEQAVARVEEIGAALAAGSATLEESVALYKEAGELIQYAGTLLSAARLEIETLTGQAGEDAQ